MAEKERTVARRSTDQQLMPPPPKKKIKRPSQVLDEDVYADAVSQIIARDFFPGLLETEAQNEYLSALQSKDRDWIQQAGRSLTAVMTPGPGRRTARGTSFTPRGSVVADTPKTVRSMMGETPTPSESGEQIRPDINMSIGAFQARYTSEDNESFNELLDKQNDRQTTKYVHFFHGNKIPTARQLEYRAERRLLASQDLVVSNSSGEQRQLVTGGRPSEDLDTRPASIESFRDRQGPKNSFMFEPDSVEDQMPTASSLAADASKAPPKAVVYTATRFSADQDPDRPASPTMSSIDAIIARRGTVPPSSADYSGSETPRVNGYAFVDEEPTPSELGVAVTDEEAEAAEREAFDKFLPQIDNNGPNLFHINQQSKREGLHHKLVEKSDIERRKSEQSKRRRLATPARGTPGMTPRRMAAQMTPAAKSLAAKLATPRKGW